MARMSNSIVSTNSDNQKFSVAIRSEALQGLIKSAIPDAQAAARFVGSLISVVAETPKLQECTPASVVAAGLRGEGLGLMLNIGYHIVPYGRTAKMSIAAKGLIQMALSGNDVADIDARPVREGERTGRNRRTGRPEIDYSVYDTDEEAEKHPIIGYYAYIEMRNGYFRSEYMSFNELLKHAERYSKAGFSAEKYYQMVNGELSKEDVDKLMEKPWYGSTDAMMRKTVMRRLLNSGYVILSPISKERMDKAFVIEDENDAAEDVLASFDVVSVDGQTGEITSESVQEPAQTQETAEPTPDATDAPAPKKRTRKAQKAHDAHEAQYVEFTPVENSNSDDDVIGSIFG